MNKGKIDEATISVLPNLPDYFDRVRREEFPTELIGAEIESIGTPASGIFEGGGFVIDYKVKGNETIKRIILSFNELGMWIDYVGFRGY